MDAWQHCTAGALLGGYGASLMLRCVILYKYVVQTAVCRTQCTEHVSLEVKSRMTTTTVDFSRQLLVTGYDLLMLLLLYRVDFRFLHSERDGSR